MNDTRLMVRSFLLLGACVALGGCAAIADSFQAPGVSLTSFRALPMNGLSPQFEVGLRVTNPNPIGLNIEGLAYAIQIDGQELVEGSTTDLPSIAANGSGDVTLRIAPDLAAGVALVTDLLRNRRDSVSYALQAEIDVGSFLPPFRVQDTGEVALTAN